MKEYWVNVYEKWPNIWAKSAKWPKPSEAELWPNNPCAWCYGCCINSRNDAIYAVDKINVK